MRERYAARPGRVGVGVEEGRGRRSVGEVLQHGRRRRSLKTGRGKEEEEVERKREKER